MKEIDYIYKNFDPNAFAKNLKKRTKNRQYEDGSTFLTNIVLDSVRDINQIKNEINRYQFTNIKQNKVFSNFAKKFKNNYSDKDIEKYFFEKMNVFNNRIHDLGDCEYLLQMHVNCGEFFRKLNKFFEITFYAQVTYKNNTKNNSDGSFGIFEDVFCLYVPLNKKFYLFFFGYEEDGNDSSGTIKIFSKKPDKNELIKSIKSEDFFRYSDLIPKDEKIIKEYSFFKFDTAYNRIFSDGNKLKHETKPHFTNEEDYFNYHNTKGESYIASNIVLSNPEKYFKKYFKSWKQVYPYLAVRSDKMRKVKDNKFFKFVMSDRFNYRNNKKFIEKIIYSYDDLEGFLEYIPKNIQESKTFKEDIRILRLFRGKNKNFIIKVFRTNKDKLEDLAKNYMPSTIFDDSYFMNELIKLDINFTADIGKKLKRNKNFMSKVKKLLDTK